MDVLQVNPKVNVKHVFEERARGCMEEYGTAEFRNTNYGDARDEEAAFDDWVAHLGEHDYAYDVPKKALREAWNASAIAKAMRRGVERET